MENDDFTDLLQELHAGKEKAFRRIYEKYNPALRYFCFRYLSDKENVSDVVQEVFIKLWEVRLAFRDEAALRSYLYKTARSICLNQLRHEKVEDKYCRYIGEQENSESFLENMMEAEIFDLLNRIFEEIPAACRNVYLSSLEGKKHSEIAQLFNLSVNSVKKYKNRAHHFLKDRIKLFYR